MDRERKLLDVDPSEDDLGIVEDLVLLPTVVDDLVLRPTEELVLVAVPERVLIVEPLDVAPLCLTTDVR